MVEVRKIRTFISNEKDRSHRRGATLSGRKEFTRGGNSPTLLQKRRNTHFFFDF